MNDETLYKLVDKLSLDYFNKPFKHTVEFNHRLRTTGGRYIPSQKKIELNPKYAMEADEAEFIGIIKHELCHHHLHIEGKGYKHGDRAFKDLLKATGSPRYCRPLKSNLRKFKHLYKCKTCNQSYNRVRRVNTNKYRCSKCEGEIVLIT